MAELLLTDLKTYHTYLSICFKGRILEAPFSENEIEIIKTMTETTNKNA